MTIGLRRGAKWQCSHCERTYTFAEFMKLDKISDERFSRGFIRLCKCGRPFHRNVWHTETEIDGYVVRTRHLELAHGSNVIGADETNDYWYETRIRDPKGKWLSFQVRYRTRQEAIAGHDFTVKHINDILSNPSKFPQDISYQALFFFGRLR